MSFVHMTGTADIQTERLQSLRNIADRLVSAARRRDRSHPNSIPGLRGSGYTTTSYFHRLPSRPCRWECVHDVVRASSPGVDSKSLWKMFDVVHVCID